MKRIEIIKDWDYLGYDENRSQKYLNENPDTRNFVGVFSPALYRRDNRSPVYNIVQVCRPGQYYSDDETFIIRHCHRSDGSDWFSVTIVGNGKLLYQGCPWYNYTEEDGFVFPPQWDILSLEQETGYEKSFKNIFKDMILENMSEEDYVELIS